MTMIYNSHNSVDHVVLGGKVVSVNVYIGHSRGKKLPGMCGNDVEHFLVGKDRALVTNHS